MNKKLLAVAVAGALAAPVAAFAQSSVTLYGNVDVAYQSKVHKTGSGATASSTLGIGEGTYAGNRVGFRGTEDLGGGMSAMFTIEQGINITNGALFGTRAAAGGQQYDGTGLAPPNMPAGAYSTGTNRQSFVGLKGRWGEVLGGYQYTTLYRLTTLNGYGVGSEGLPGQDLSHGLVDNGNYGGTRANGFVYNSPIFADGFQVSVLKGAGTGRESANFNTIQPDGKTQNNAHRWSIMPTYNKGPLSLSLGYTKFKAQGNTVIASALCPVNVFGACTAAATATASSVNLRSRLWQFGGSYKLGGWKFAATYASGKKDDDGVSAAAVRTGVDTKSKAYQGGVEYTMGAWRPFVTLGRAKTDNRTAGTVSGDFKLYQFGLRYDLSKRTVVYVMHGQTKDDSTTGDGAGLRKRTATSLGMYMSF